MDKKEFILDIKRLGINGEGIGFYNRKAIFVKNAIPGEGVNIEIVKDTPKMAFGKIINIKKQSPNRIKPLCAYYEQCGACQTMHIKNEFTGELKRELIIESISRYTSLNPKTFEIKKTLTMVNPLNYRNKSALIVRKTNGLNTLSMIEENSNKTFAIDSCLIQDEKINEVNKNIIELANKLDVKSFGDEKYSLRYLVTRVSLSTRESLVCLVCFEYNEEIKEFAKSIVANKLADSVYVNVNNDKRTHEIFGDTLIHIGGKKFIIEQIDRYKYQIYPTTFFQLNSLQTKVLYDNVKRACKLSHKERVLDAFCGVGTIGIYLANLAKEVVGIESNKESIESAKINAKNNKVNNISFYQGDVTKLLPKLLKDNMGFDVLVFDPPRTGLGEKVCNMVLESNAKRVVYVSCNPATLAKDLNILSAKYKVSYIQPVDMFPNTSHVESILRLDLKK